MRTALFPGSFDPLHNGHVEVVEEAARLFDQVVVAAMRNPQKRDAMFSLDERTEMMTETFAHLPNVTVTSFSALVVDLAKEVGADVIVKGLRATTDFEYELQMAQMNKSVSGIDTLFLPTATTSSFIASSLVSEIARFGGADRVAHMVPPQVHKRLMEKYPS